MKLRRRIALSMLSVVAISGGVSTLIGAHLLWRHLGREAQNRVRQDLNAAREFYNQRLEELAISLRYTALGDRFCEAVAHRDLDYLGPRLTAVRQAAMLDMLCVTDAAGRVIHAGPGGSPASRSMADDRLVGPILAGRDAVRGFVLLPVDALREEDPALAHRAAIAVLPTTKARPMDKTVLDSGMALVAAAAVRDRGGRLLGVLRAATLLGGNYDLVDRVQNTVFHDEKYHGKLLGTATVFQDDVRISTNVLNPDGSRAVGTRVSAEVYDAVMGGGRTWVGPAWVVHDWFISAYEPIQDIDGRPIGMLYVGVLQKKFSDVAAATFVTFSLVTLAGLLAATLVAWKLSDSISSPIRRLARAADDVARGDFSATLPVSSSDEINQLAGDFNAMARSLRERDELLKERTRQQLTRSERLASIGRLAAGVAHEINNPLTGVLTFAHMLRKTAPPDSEDRQDIETIIDATTRCRDIVRGLLNFSRQNEPRKSLSDLNAVLRAAVHLIENQARINRICVEQRLDESLPSVVLDPNQIQEVAVNVMVNAVDAMVEGGVLSVRSRPATDNGSAWVEFEIADTGCGIPPEHLEHVFDPFFTTKPVGKGTGLGLAISYGIVSEHGGQIQIASRGGEGTRVTVRLPAAAQG